MERGKPTKEHMTALYDLIDRLFEGKDAFHSEEEPEGLREKGEAIWV